MNRIVLIGRLVADPEERFTNDGTAISKFRIAVDRRRRGQDGEKEADFFNVVAFRQTADFVNKYMRRGNLVAVDGRCQIDNYTDREGNRQMWIEVQADNVQSLTSRSESEGDGGSRREGGGGRWAHDEDFPDEAPAGRGGDDKGRARDDEPREGGARRQKIEQPRGRSQQPVGGGFDDDENDPFADE